MNELASPNANSRTQRSDTQRVHSSAVHSSARHCLYAGEATEKVSKAFQSDGKVGKEFEKDRTTGHEGKAAEVRPRSADDDCTA